MKSTKFQHPSTRETSNPKLQYGKRTRIATEAVWILEIGASLDVGAWNLELF
jgi:hypothetical protein